MTAALAITGWLIVGLCVPILFRINPIEDPMDAFPLLLVADTLEARVTLREPLTLTEMQSLAGALRDIAFAGPPGERQDVVILPPPKAWRVPGGAA